MPYPLHRPRRLRAQAFSRDLMCENTLNIKHLIQPLFVCEGKNTQHPIASMPNMARLSVDLLLKEVEQLATLGIPAIALFPVVSDGVKSLDAAEAWNPEGLMQRAIRAVKQHFPQIGIIGDIALDPYTTHGQDGLIDANGYVLNDETIEGFRHRKRPEGFIEGVKP